MNAVLTGTADTLFSTVLLASYETSMLKNIVIQTTINSYPGIGDGFNRLSGVAPGCRWAAAKVESRDGVVDDNDFPAALDDLVVHRVQANIKIISISYGITDDNDLPIESVPLRDKVNTTVNNGILVVSAAGNSAEEKAAAQWKMADPPRAMGNYVFFSESGGIVTVCLDSAAKPTERRVADPRSLRFGVAQPGVVSRSTK